MRTLHQKNEPKKVGCGGHVVLTILTLGLWLILAPVVIGLGMWASILAKYKCQVCGR